MAGTRKRKHHCSICGQWIGRARIQELAQCRDCYDRENRRKCAAAYSKRKPPRPGFRRVRPMSQRPGHLEVLYPIFWYCWRAECRRVKIYRGRTSEQSN